MEINMKYLYIILVSILVLILSYFAGVHAGKIRCRTQSVANTFYEQTKSIEIQRKINAETVQRTVDDIRHVLREKYTIAE